MDTTELMHALHAVDADPSADLLTRIRAGGERRQHRRTRCRRAAVAGGAVVALAVIPAFAEVTSSSRPASRASIVPAASAATALPAPTAATSATAGWRTRWPLPATTANCGRGFGAEGRAQQFPELLLLPAGPVESAYLRDSLTECPRPHAALLLQRRGSATVAGLTISGPNAPTPAETGAFGRGTGFMGRIGHEPIQGRPALSATFDAGGDKGGTIYWTTADGGQWEATLDGLGWQEAQALLDGLTMSAEGGTATMDAATAAAWSVVPSPPDPAATGHLPAPYAGHYGTLEASWSEGVLAVQLSVQEGNQGGLTPLRLACCATTDVNGDPAELQHGTGTVDVTWTLSPGVYASLHLGKGTDADALRIARGLTVASPSDPRIHEPANDPSPYPTP